MLENQRSPTNVEFLTVEEVAKILKTTPGVIYTYIYNSRKKKRGNSPIPNDVYIKFGRKTLFIKEKLFDWLLIQTNVKGDIKNG